MEETIQARVAKLVALVSEISPQNVEVPTLIYFDIIGIAWPIRCLLHLENIEYRYVPVSIMEWMFESKEGQKPLKSAFGNGHVPLYVDQDVQLNQSTLILTTLARRAGMMGDSDRESLEIEAILAHCYDSLFHWNGMLGVNVRLNIEDDIAQARLNSFMGDGVWGVVTNGYRNHLNAFATYLASNLGGSGFLVGNRMSAADLCAFNVLCNWYKAFEPKVFSEEYPSLDEYIQRIALVPGIADYIRAVQEPTVWFNLPDIALRLTSPQELEGLVSLPD